MLEQISYARDWAIFEKSEEYQTLRKVRDTSYIPKIVETYYKIRDGLHYPADAAWDKTMIEDTVTMMDQSFGDKNDSYDTINGMKAINREVARLYFINLAKAKLVDLTEAQIEQLLKWQAKKQLPMPAEAETETADLPKWLGYVHDDIETYTHQWCEAFVQSASWAEVSPLLDADDAMLIVDTLATQIYATYRKTPKAWTKYAIYGVLTHYFVREVGLRYVQFKQIVPMMTSFLTFCGQQNYLNPKKAASYSRFFESAEKDLLALAFDQTHFSDAKRISLQMLAQGVNVDNPDEVQRFIDKRTADEAAPVHQTDHVGRIVSKSTARRLFKKHKKRR